MNDQDESNMDIVNDDSGESRDKQREEVMGSVPEDSLLGTTESADRKETSIDAVETSECRRLRTNQKSRKVPNLLSGPALIPGPVTPNVAPVGAPDLSYMLGKSHQFAIFPQFMLSTNHITEDPDESESRMNFVREAMEKAVGLPPLLIDPNMLKQEQMRERRYRRDRYRREPIRPQSSREEEEEKKSFKNSENDFPILDGPRETENIETTTPSPPRKKWSKFPSKNCQIKKMSLTSL